MSATEQDQKRAVALLRAAAADGLIQDTEPRHQPAMVERIAAALAEERERVRAPFLALAAELERQANGVDGTQLGYEMDVLAGRLREVIEGEA